MIRFAEKPVASYDEYNLYCHYVAGLVGIGLSHMFAAGGESSELSSKAVVGVPGLANSMGLFLQKTNIIRDYLEDLLDNRTFWPKEIWSKYGKTLGSLRESGSEASAVACLNHMITDALELVPQCLEYLEMIKDPQNFNFCVIPQVMAIATLDELYGNYKVFKGVVKIRRGLSAKMMLGTRSMDDCRAWFRTFAKSIDRKVTKSLSFKIIFHFLFLFLAFDGNYF